MAKKNDDILGKIAGLGALLAGLVILDYALFGRRENDAALLPNRFEDQIDRAVAELDRRFTKQWVNRSLDSIQRSLQRALPPQVVAAVYAAELTAKSNIFRPMSGAAKKQVALNKLRLA